MARWCLPLPHHRPCVYRPTAIVTHTGAISSAARAIRMRRCVIRSAAAPLDFQAFQRASCASRVSVTWAATGVAICRVVMRYHILTIIVFSCARRNCPQANIAMSRMPVHRHHSVCQPDGDQARHEQAVEAITRGRIDVPDKYGATGIRRERGRVGRSEAAVARRRHVRTDSSKVIQSGVSRTTAGPSPRLCNREQQSRAAIRTLRACKPIM